jgi:hypothetical protein
MAKEAYEKRIGPFVDFGPIVISAEEIKKPINAATTITVSPHRRTSQAKTF